MLAIDASRRAARRIRHRLDTTTSASVSLQCQPMA